MLSISPGREEEFRYFQRWLEASAALERVIEATEEDNDSSHRQRRRQLTRRCHDR